MLFCTIVRYADDKPWEGQGQSIITVLIDKPASMLTQNSASKVEGILKWRMAKQL